MNKNNLAVGKVASKSNIRPDLSCVADYGDRTIATDSFSLIEMSDTRKKKSEPVLYFAKDLQAIKVKKGEIVDEKTLIPAPIKGDTYPKIDVVLDSAEKNEYIELVVNAEYLANICNVLKNLDPFNAITLKVPTSKSYKPLLITANSGKNAAEKQTARALLMPINR